MTEKQVVNINIDLVKLRDIAEIGVRRAVLFMGLGLNAAHREDFKDYELHKLPRVAGQTGLPISFFPSDLPDERIKEFKRQFAIWITGAGFRELIEHYSAMLDNIHMYSLIIAQQKGVLGDANPQKKQNKFLNRGFTEKNQLLKEDFGIELPQAARVDALYRARNCLAHAQGRVLRKHCTTGTNLVLSWLAMDTVAIGEETGQEQHAIELMGKVTTEPMKIEARTAARERTFAEGDMLLLSQQDLWEICAFFSLSVIPETVKAFADYGVAQGVPDAAADVAKTQLAK